MMNAEETKEARAERRKRISEEKDKLLDETNEHIAKLEEFLSNRPQREAERRRELEAEHQQREDVAGLKVRATRSEVVLGLVVAWQIVLTVGLLYVALTDQSAEQQPAEQATCPSPGPGN